MHILHVRIFTLIRNRLFLRVDKYKPHDFHQFGNEQSIRDMIKGNESDRRYRFLVISKEIVQIVLFHIVLSIDKFAHNSVTQMYNFNGIYIKM